MTDSTPIDLHHEADLVRLFMTVWTHNRLGETADESTRLRVLDALSRLEQAATERVA